MSILRLPCLLAAGLLLAGCPAPGGPRKADAPTGARTPPPPPTTPVPADKPLDPGSPRAQAEARAQVARFEDERGLERVDAAKRLATLGEPALPPLFEALAGHPGARTRGMAAYTLGFMNDRRAVEPLARALADPDPEVRYDAAAALLRLGDDRGFLPLIRGLEDPDPRRRAQAIGNLREAVGESLGFEPDGDPLERSAAVARWRGWLERRREGGR